MQTKVNSDDPNNIYIGTAINGALTSEPKWNIILISTVWNETSILQLPIIEWNNEYWYIWDDKETYIYN